MATRLPASERTREELRALIDGRLASSDARSALLRLATRLIVEEALEAEVEDALGRGYYEHGAAAGAGYRNGYRTGRLKTAEGPIGYAAPQVANREAPFRSALREGLQGRTEALEDLAVELFARGLSTRDIADVFTTADGRPLLSRAAVSQLSERLWAEYQAFASRDLAEHAIVYLFVDGIAERLRPGQPREAVLAAWGIARDGCKVLLHLMAGSREDLETVRAFFQDMRARGLGDPLLVVTDGAPGSSAPPRSASRAPPASAASCTGCATWWSRSPSPLGRSSRSGSAPAIRRRRGRSPASCARGWSPDYERELPNAVACFEDDFEACIAHLRFPITHRRALRTTNLLERLFLEERRRLKIIPNAFGEKAVLKLMYGAMIRAAERWRGLPVTDFERRQLEAIQAELNAEYQASIGRPAAAPQPKVSSTQVP